MSHVPSTCQNLGGLSQLREVVRIKWHKWQAGGHNTNKRQSPCSNTDLSNSRLCFWLLHYAVVPFFLWQNWVPQVHSDFWLLCVMSCVSVSSVFSPCHFVGSPLTVSGNNLCSVPFLREREFSTLLTAEWLHVKYKRKQISTAWGQEMWRMTPTNTILNVLLYLTYSLHP